MKAATTTPSPNKREALNIRIKPEERDLIDRAAKIQRKSRTNFVLEAACRAAEEALFDQFIISVDPKAYTDFLTRLDTRPQPNDQLQKTMQTVAPWDKL